MMVILFEMQDKQYATVGLEESGGKHDQFKEYAFNLMCKITQNRKNKL